MRFLAAGLFLLIGAAPSAAAAQIKDGLASTLTSTAGSMAFRDRTLSPGWGMEAPDPLRDARVAISSPRVAVGGLLRETLILRGVRWSFGVGVASLPGEGARVSGVTGGYEARGRTPWAGLFDVSVGRQLRVGPVFPYIDARASLSMVESRVELRSPTDGRLSVTGYQRSLVELGPRAGLWFPLGSTVHLDLSARAGLLGPERFGIDLGLGFYLPFALPWNNRRRSS